MFSANKETRSIYGDLFRFGHVKKSYEAIGILPPVSQTDKWLIESRIVKGYPWFLSRNEEGDPNARTAIRLCEARNGLGYFLLEPFTGKQHQLRLHMTMIGGQIINDFYYPIFIFIKNFD